MQIISRILPIALFLLVIISLVSCGGSLERDVPQDTWVPIFFASRIEGQPTSTGIHATEKIFGLDRLDEEHWFEPSPECRIWVGFGLTQLRVVVLKKSWGNWSAHLHPGHREYFPGTNSSSGVLEIVPDSGWSEFWNNLNSLGFFSLPDQSSLEYDELWVLDGVSYVVEIRQDGRYRTYMYGNPEHHHRKEDQAFVKIIGFINKELNIEI